MGSSDSSGTGSYIPRVYVHGEVLAALMTKHHMRAGGLALRAGVSAGYVRMLCSGQRTSVKLPTAQRIADVMGEPLRAFATPLPRYATRPADPRQRNQGGRKSA